MTQTLWDESKLAVMIRDGVEESLNIEYKAAAALSREPRKIIDVTKDVSAMANSAGGILIYGISQHKAPKEHLPERIDPISRSIFSKEWLEQIIAQIQPRIVDLKIHPVQLKSNLDHVVYVVEVPQGTTAHQAKDGRYYRRYNFEAVPMVDHEVKDVMSRNTSPLVSLTLKFVEYPQPNEDRKSGVLVVSTKNLSDVFARYVAFAVYSPLRVRGKIVVYDNDKATIDNGDDGEAFKLEFSNHASAPLFPRGTLKHFFYFRYGLSMDPEPQKQLTYFRWVAFADAMPMQSGKFTVDEVFA